MTTRLVQLIYTDDGRKGTGQPDDYMRSVPRLYTTDGQLVCEFDIGKAGDGSDSESYVGKSALQRLAATS